MNFKNSQKIILTISTCALAIVAFACQNTAPNSSVNSANSISGPVNSADSALANQSEPAKPPTMTDYPVGNAQSPSEAYRMLFAGVKSRDTAKIKSMLSKNTLSLAEMWGGQQKKPVDEVVKNGFSETTFADGLPQLRDERAKGNFAAVEVWNEMRKKWDDIPLVKEEGGWKIAFGDQFFGQWESPAKSQSIVEQEAVNARSPKMVPANPMANSNINVIKPKRMPESDK